MLELVSMGDGAKLVRILEGMLGSGVKFKIALIMLSFEPDDFLKNLL